MLGKDTDHPFSLYRYTLKPGTISGQATVFPVYSFSGFPYINQSQAASHLDVGSSLDYTAEATKAMAKTNPSRADVSVPNFLFELKDIPEMLHLKGIRYHEKSKGNSVAEQNFGWGALIGDLQRLTDFTGQVNKRVKELKALHSRRGLRRKYTALNETHVAVDENVYFHSFEVVARGHVQKKTTRRVWVSVRWETDDVTLHPDDELTSLARRVVHGWTPDSGTIGADIWEATPWSWFADYFLNVGDFMKASKNSVGATPACCVMDHQTTHHEQVVEFTSDGIGCSPSASVYETKNRVLGTAGIRATMPFLSASQLTTLSGIAANLT